MATLQYTVFFSATETGKGPVLNENVIAIGGASAQSSTVVDPSATPNNQSRCVRIACDANAWVIWGADPTALDTGVGGRMIGSGNPEYFDIPANHRIAVIARA
jgi:hypothetical protein